MRKITWAGLTDVGKKRTGNEDAFVVNAELGLFVVCDGMGGHASGEVASAMTTEEINAFFQTRDEGDRSLPYTGEPSATVGELVISNAIQHANDRVYVAGMSDSALEGMGTTVVAVTEWEDKIILAHVGDSRIYRYRDGRLEQVTRDHSLLNHKIDLGELQTPDEIENFKYGNVIVRAVGLKDYVRPETSVHERINGDVYVLCSDGLSDMVDDWSLENVIEANHDDLDLAVGILVRMANDRGGKDNITAVLVRVDDELDADEAAEGEAERGDVDQSDEGRGSADRLATAPGLKAVAGPDDAEVEDPDADLDEGNSDASNERTTPHAPVFAWDDDGEEEAAPAPTQQVARPQPAQRPAAPEPAQRPAAPAAPVADTRRRVQPTEELPSIILEDDDDDERTVVNRNAPPKR